MVSDCITERKAKYITGAVTYITLHSPKDDMD
jgi:hypothetical protein